MREKNSPSAETWLIKARDFYTRKNWVGALSSARNALRLDVKNLAAWHIGCDTLFADDRHYQACLYAKALKRFALKAGDGAEVAFAETRLTEIDEYYATQHLRWGETDLTHFAAKGDVEKIRALLAGGVNPNERNRSNWTALHCVGMRGKPEIARLLVEHGADLEAEEDLKETPLVTACRFGNAEIIPVLIELGANVRHRAKEKHTALWYAISSMKDVEIVKMLIAAGANANETYAWGDNPFLLAVSAQKPAVVNYLLPLTKDPARMNKHQVCAIRFAASYNDTDLIEKLLALGVDADQANDYGHTPLMSAAENNSLAAAKILLAAGADPLRKTEYGDSAVSLAERRENPEMYELLTGGRLLDRLRD